MAKISLRDPSTGYSSASNFAANNSDLEDALNNKVLYRDNPAGEANAMQNDLDMNSNRILNLPSATNSSEPVTKAQFDAASSSLTPVGFQVESIVATAGQTVFTFSSINFTVGGNTLVVFVQGAYQPPSVYTENSTTQITLSEGVNAGDVLSAIVLSLS